MYRFPDRRPLAAERVRTVIGVDRSERLLRVDSSGSVVAPRTPGIGAIRPWLPVGPVGWRCPEADPDRSIGNRPSWVASGPSAYPRCLPLSHDPALSHIGESWV